MRRRTTQLLAIPFLLVLVLAAAGCGSSKKAASTTTTTTTTAATTATSTVAATTTASTTTPATSVPSNLGALAACQPLVNLGEAFATALTGAGGDPTKEAAALQNAANKAPSAIKSDVIIIAAAYSKIANAYKNSFTPGTTPSASEIAKLASIGASIQTPAVEGAEKNLEAWAASNCHA